ncbi:hypothetical protein GQ464_003465 [Rhodocaloribacter litoris]|uniref:hypothetical protein n=1 Tax=Rhodocaloribacter litoris TaxID=2558931 RepID=UPI00141ED291|nr:hypothetical protein [Rhodocaloribacter litoris]QXD16019.1 hypothetical protein GQ464_003465 [Rhodocaloribacter litoris]GIV59746.1 MAG: hypothetical protein KatS3mg043_0835 [Rhodothermaceae bacterium]
MLRKVDTTESQGFLAHYRIPPLSFVPHARLPRVIRPVWEALNAGNPAMAIMRARHILLTHQPATQSERAALKVGLAAAELYSGASDGARRLAGHALDLYPGQWSAHRIILTILTAQRAYKAAYMHLVSLAPAGPVPLWDEPLSEQERHLALASWAWHLAEWETVAHHLQAAYPQGLETLPPALLEDWFRLSFYRNQPEEAAAAAALLIAERPAQSADEVLQTLVQCGWTKEALPLYRTAFAREPRSELLRRRLVALCIREGKLDEARALTQPGALSLAA